MLAVENENAEAIRMMLSDMKDVKLDARDKDGSTVFHYVAKAKNERISQVLDEPWKTLPLPPLSPRQPLPPFTLPLSPSSSPSL